ncbi:UvrD-helicase domain-containing protein [Candidatus Saccharibacteria bacterium]|nr:UvrD-helicase domain-containing protein [Candidatus Saccharibacteria bacterium]
MQNLLEGLNEKQKQAVENTDGPVLILAGAGSGKTKTLTHRIAHLVSNGVSPYAILAVTFTNKAAKEMRTRVAELLGQSYADRSFMPYMGTFHSICVRILRQDGEYVGIPKNFVIFDESDRQSAIKQACKKLYIDEKQFKPSALSGLISAAKNELISPEVYAGTATLPAQKVAAKVFPLYQQALRDAGALDFDDLIGRTVAMLKHNPELQQKWQLQFKYIMVDEYQDTNNAQYTLIKLLLNESKNICVVGDDWQSIYSWRGADFRNILNFERDFPGATLIKLEENYRSTKNILDAAHKVITKNEQRSDKELWTRAGAGAPVQIVQVQSESHEGESIVSKIKTQVNLKVRTYNDFAILYRTNAQSRSLEEAFLRYGVPYRVVGGVRFYDRKEIKDIMAYIRLLYQPEDSTSFLRIVNVPTRGVGTRSLEKFFDWASEKQLTLSQAINQVQTCTTISGKALKGLIDLSNLLNDLRIQKDDLGVAPFIDAVIRRTRYKEYLDDDSPQSIDKIENVKELISVAKEYETLGLDGFLEEIALVSNLDGIDEQSDAVTLMTLHAAKGLEFPVVFLAGMEESIFPHSRTLFDAAEMEEERRLCYVGMTRAREELFMYHANSRMLYGSSQHNPPSRFLSEVDGEHESGGFFAEPLFTPNVQQSESHYTPEPGLEVAVGTRVKHQLFGIGTVVDVDGEMLSIAFKTKGVKKLNASFAPLELLS